MSCNKTFRIINSHEESVFCSTFILYLSCCRYYSMFLITKNIQLKCCLLSVNERGRHAKDECRSVGGKLCSLIHMWFAIVSVNKAYWNIAIVISKCIFCGFYHTKRIDLNSSNTDHMVHEAENIYFQALYI